MAHQYFFDGDLVVGKIVTVTGEDARHAVIVSRLRVGEQIQLSNGKGILAIASVMETSKESFSASIAQVLEAKKLLPEIWLVQALAKSDRDELAIQTATELGVSVVIPWFAERSIVKWSQEKSAKNLERWQKIVREAAKQSLRADIPEVKAPLTTAQLSSFTAGTVALVLDPNAKASLPSTELLSAAERLVIIVGPEGGIGDSELQKLTVGGAIPVRLGSNVLRTSTAGPAAIAAINQLLARW